ncbi:aromatic amino acid ammonia-lyase [Mangrovihabitans endophyticus]|uniref:Histidine ammonia-lyase n=1 Tax=Mangrovihabitans endophyticus TaxID=1751298 RepID=A0A8J3FKM5_9ACTN|nr:aromatic amino acid ammonia-lyase [Mangrovihabitans endophyticus]GGK73774.1 histidine ammonia-lyase [Mangrovihabitans endophyticus]
MTSAGTAIENHPDTDPVLRLVARTRWGSCLLLTDAERRSLRITSRRMSYVAASSPVYGVTHGFGALVQYEADPDPSKQAAGLLAHLGAGQGDPLPPDVVRTMVWLRLQSMRRGYSGVDPRTWDALARQWNAGFTPVVPAEGSLSASGDLIPLAHAAQATGGHGEAWADPAHGGNAREPAHEALRRQGLRPVRWDARSALSFVNGTSAALALALHNHARLCALVRASAEITGVVVARLGAGTEAYTGALAAVRGHPGHRTAAAWIRAAAGAVRPDLRRPMQEPYSLRCAPQVLGAVLDQLRAQGAILATEADGCTDNPVLVDGVVLHGGNFHAAPVVLAVEQQALCVHQVAYLAERQLALLVDPARNGGRPPFLTPHPGPGSGLAGAQIAATAHLGAIRQLGYPASMTPVPTNLGNQDHVPMALNAANAVRAMLERAWWIMGTLVLATHQLAFHGSTPHGGTGHPIWDWCAANVPALDEDRPLAGEVRAAAAAAADLFQPTAEPMSAR